MKIQLVSTIFIFDSSQDVMPRFAKEDLENMPVNKPKNGGDCLTDICTKYNVCKDKKNFFKIFNDN